MLSQKPPSFCKKLKEMLNELGDVVGADMGGRIANPTTTSGLCSHKKCKAQYWHVSFFLIYCFVLFCSMNCLFIQTDWSLQPGSTLSLNMRKKHFSEDRELRPPDWLQPLSCIVNVSEVARPVEFIPNSENSKHLDDCEPPVRVLLPPGGAVAFSTWLIVIFFACTCFVFFVLHLFGFVILAAPRMCKRHQQSNASSILWPTRSWGRL